MKTVLGALLILAGIVLGLYVGVYLMFYGGIVQVIDGATADPVAAGDIAFGVVRIWFAALVGWASAALLMVPGGALIASDD